MRLQMQGTTTMPGSGVGARGQLAPVRLGGREATVTLSHLGRGPDTTRIRPTHPTADTTTRDRVPGTQGAATPTQPRRVAQSQFKTQSQYKAQALGLIRPSEASVMPLVHTDHGKPSQNSAHTWRPQLFSAPKDRLGHNSCPDSLAKSLAAADWVSQNTLWPQAELAGVGPHSCLWPHPMAISSRLLEWSQQDVIAQFSAGLASGLALMATPPAAGVGRPD